MTNYVNIKSFPHGHGKVGNRTVSSDRLLGITAGGGLGAVFRGIRLRFGGFCAAGGKGDYQRQGKDHT